MKRSRNLRLFQSIEPDVYLIDTSAWLHIDSRADADAIWKLVVGLIEKGRIFTCAQVLLELHDNPIYLLRLKPYERALLAGEGTGSDLEYLQRIGKITYDYPAMSKATGWKTPADPYVVALAELEGYVVVTDETATKRPNRKIPGVCKQLGIRCITLAEFVSAASVIE